MKNYFGVTLLALSLTLGFGLFQNCSQSDLVFEDKMASLTLEQLNYRYSEKPSFYIEPLLVLEDDPNPGKRFKVMLYIGKPSESSTQGTLRLKVLDDENRLICPQDSLDLSLGTKVWTVHCVPPGAFSAAVLHISVEGSDHNFNYTQSYFFK